MPTAAHHRGRVLATLCVAGAHLYLSLIAFIGLLSYTVPTRYSALQEAASDQLWAWVHLFAAVLLLVSLFNPQRHFVWHGHVSVLPVAAFACSVGFAAMMTWSFFNAIWGLTTTRPVSLAGPGLALFVAVGELLLANAWTRGTHDKGR